MQREKLVCAACGADFQRDDFSREIGELVTCPSCGSVEIEIGVVPDDAQQDAA